MPDKFLLTKANWRVQPWVRGRSAGSFPEQRLLIKPSQEQHNQGFHSDRWTLDCQCQEARASHTRPLWFSTSVSQMFATLSTNDGCHVEGKPTTPAEVWSALLRVGITSCSEIKTNGSFRSHQLCKSELIYRSNSSRQIIKYLIRRVWEEEHLENWELENFFKMTDKFRKHFGQVSLANTKTVDKALVVSKVLIKVLLWSN